MGNDERNPKETRVGISRAHRVSRCSRYQCEPMSPYIYYTRSITHSTRHHQTSFESVLLSFPCLCQHCLNVSIYILRQLKYSTWPDVNIVVVCRQHLGLRSHTPRFRNSSRATHLLLARPPILLLVVAVRQFHILDYRCGQLGVFQRY
jgi:hypothetical protein